MMDRIIILLLAANLLSALPAAFPGALTGMYFFHHKTRHRKFVYGVPAIGIVEITAAMLLVL